MPNGKKRSNANHRRNRNGRPHPAAAQAQHRNAGRRQTDNTGGNAKRNYERYMALAREAAAAGDAIESENLFQHAEHYLRAMREHGDGRSGHDGSATPRNGPPAS